MKNSPNASQTVDDIQAARSELSALDTVLAVAHKAVESFQWDIRQSGFPGLIQLITEQQVSVASAAAIWRRFQAGVGEVTSKNVAQFDVETSRTFGLSSPKAKYVQAIAMAEESGAIKTWFEVLELDDYVTFGGKA